MNRGKGAPPTARQMECLLALIEHRTTTAGGALGVDPETVRRAAEGAAKLAPHIDGWASRPR